MRLLHFAAPLLSHLARGPVARHPHFAHAGGWGLRQAFGSALIHSAIYHALNPLFRMAELGGGLGGGLALAAFIGIAGAFIFRRRQSGFSGR
jgi:hypothetical protein